jgi:predicted nucleic acid-binding protein
VIVVADAGPLIYLSAVGSLELLRPLGKVIVVPAAVHDEVVIAGVGLPGAAEVAGASWLTVETLARRDVVDALLAGGLHLGESEAIALSLEKHADLLVIDERQGRLAAERMGLHIVGTVGVLIAAKQRGDIPVVAPVLAALRAAGLWASDELVDRVLKTLGEK